jgi:phosphoglucosamine mutase
VANKQEARENPKVVEAVEKAAEILGNDGRILVRESGTEPVIRVMVEASTDDICQEHVGNVIRVMEAEGLIVK